MRIKLTIRQSWLIISLLLFDISLALTQSTPQIAFVDVTAKLGFDFEYQTDFSPERRLVETMGGGGTLLDFDGDGDLDLYLVQGADLDNLQKDSKKRMYSSNRLYRNESGKHFVDVTEQAQVGDNGYGLGAVSADYDGDGDVDIYVTNLGSNILYQNNGNGTFSDVTQIAGLTSDLLSTSAAFFDYDRDGDLDLYLCNYVDYDLSEDIPCYFGQLRIYCGPNEYDGIADQLYQNNGDGSFTDVTKRAGVWMPTARGLGVICPDVNDDGWADIYVANDMNPNTLFINQGNGTFKEEGQLRGCAYNSDGIANGSMGVDVGDYDNDGDMDLWVTNFSLEANCLMANDGGGYFDDLTFDIGLAEPSFVPLAFGTKFIDYDNDGWLDIVVGNGHIWDNVHQIDSSMTYAQPLQLFKNKNGVFTEVVLEGLASYVVRGLMTGDYDNDGDQDLFLCQSNRPLVVLENQLLDKNETKGVAWLTLDLLSNGLNSNGIGTTVKVIAGAKAQTKQLLSGGSYLVGNDTRLSFGLSSAEIIDKIEIYWPSGCQEVLMDIQPRQILTIEQKNNRPKTE